MTKRIPGLFLAAALFVGTPAAAQVVTFETSPTTFSEFSGSVTESGFTYSESSGALFMNIYGNPGNDLEGSVQNGGGVAMFVAELGGLFTFAGLDYAAWQVNGTGTQTLEVRGYLNDVLLGTDSFLLSNTAVYSPAFANWTTFNSVNLANLNLDELQVSLNAVGGSLQAIDNVRFGAATGVPEPTTWAMMLIGFGAIGGAMRNRRRRGIALKIA